MQCILDICSETSLGTFGASTQSRPAAVSLSVCQPCSINRWHSVLMMRVTRTTLTETG